MAPTINPLLQCRQIRRIASMRRAGFSGGNQLNVVVFEDGSFIYVNEPWTAQYMPAVRGYILTFPGNRQPGFPTSERHVYITVDEFSSTRPTPDVVVAAYNELHLNRMTQAMIKLRAFFIVTMRKLRDKIKGPRAHEKL